MICGSSTVATRRRAPRDVDPEEAVWLLDTLEGLFGFYFLEEAALQKKRGALDAKLKEAGRAPLRWAPLPRATRTIPAQSQVKFEGERFRTV